MADRPCPDPQAGLLVGCGAHGVLLPSRAALPDQRIDHQTGVIVWCAAGRNAQTLRAFFDELGERKHSIRAVSIDMSGG